MEELEITDSQNLNEINYKEEYEKLKEATKTLVEQINQQNDRQAQINEDRDMFMMYKRMDYLFQILNISDKFPESFINKCINEIIQVLNFKEDEAK